ncbi:hypothetical protein L1987_43665 [Smallanthus sonchifolius]|uniref:Uncharacterized protein n=1 Tax=Smallanthus sonchifolius TaxID=185202 RepID=A0ACB9GM84_9ASTR|nr:hypothetical protein L1987_43665 [Smallanthus sonchifolius]
MMLEERGRMKRNEAYDAGNDYDDANDGHFSPDHQQNVEIPEVVQKEYEVVVYKVVVYKKLTRNWRKSSRRTLVEMQMAAYLVKLEGKERIENESKEEMELRKKALDNVQSIYTRRPKQAKVIQESESENPKGAKFSSIIADITPEKIKEDLIEFLKANNFKSKQMKNMKVELRKEEAIRVYATNELKWLSGEDLFALEKMMILHQSKNQHEVDFCYKCIKEFAALSMRGPRDDIIDGLMEELEELMDEVDGLMKMEEVDGFKRGLE